MCPDADNPASELTSIGKNVTSATTAAFDGQSKPNHITMIGATAGNHLRRRDVGAARLDRDVEPGLLVETFFLGHEVTGELGLRDPFQLDGDRVRRLRSRQ